MRKLCSSSLAIPQFWRTFLNYIHISRGWRGYAPTWDTPIKDGYADEARKTNIANMDDFRRRMESVMLEGFTGKADIGEDLGIDRPWQEQE